MVTASIIKDEIIKGDAGSVKNVSGYNSNKDTVVEFTNPQSLMLDGMSITFSGATTNTALNASHSLIKINDRKILLKGIAFTSTEEGLSSMTFTVNNSAYKSVDRRKILPDVIWELLPLVEESSMLLAVQ